MQPDEEEPRPRYSGPFVCILPIGPDYEVSIQPVLPTGEGEPRTYGSKIEAFHAARDLWTAHRLPCRDLTIGDVARAYIKNNRAVFSTF